MLRDFIQTNIYKKGIINNNPIWHIAKTSTYAYREISTNKRQAIIINIDSPPQFAMGLEPCYVFKERHLTIDKKYNTIEQQHGFYSAHYTEEYTNKIDGSWIKIHVYLDKNARCTYVQSKKYNSRAESTVITLPCEIAAVNNSNSAVEILKDFLTTRKDKYLEAIKRADELERELCDTIPLYLNKKINFANYADKAYQFIRIIEEINSYVDDYIDMRGKIVKTILDNLKKKTPSSTFTLKPSSKDIEEEEIYEDDDIEIVFTSFQATSINNLEEEKNNLLEKLHHDSERLNKIENLLEKQNILQNIKTTLLILTFNEKLMRLLSKQDKFFISNLESQVYTSNNFTEQLFVLFVEKCFMGDLDAVKKLFFHVHSKIDLTFIYNITKTVLSVQPNTQISLNVIGVMDFLYEQSPIYRMLFPVLTDVFYNNIPIRANNQPYQQSDKFKQLNNKLHTKEFCEAVTFEEICLHDCVNYKVVFFPLFKAIYTDNMPLVKTLLKHGMLASSLGAITITEQGDEHLLPIIEASFLLKCDIKYIALLYQYEAFIFRKITQMYIFEQDILLPCIKFNLTESDIIVNEYNYKCPLIPFLDTHKDLTKKHIEFFKENFMTYCNCRDLAFYLAYLANEGYSMWTITFRRSFNQEQENNNLILFFQDLRELASVMHEQENDFQNIRVAYFTRCLLGACNMVNILYQHIMTIMKEQSIDEHINIMLYLVSKLQDSNAHIKLKISHLHAALLLLSFKDQLTTNDWRQVVKILITISKLLRNENPAQSDSAKEMAEFILRKNKTCQNNFDLTLDFSKLSIEHKRLYTCEPPPGSKIINGKTEVNYSGKA